MSVMVLTLKPCTFTQADDTAYEYYLAVSSDKLLVLKRKNDTYNDYELVEYIIEGKCNNGTLFSCPDEDTFLDAIIVIKDMILSGLDPLKNLDIDGL
jgi:hypothetical protein